MFNSIGYEPYGFDDFQGSESGTQVMIGPGQYSVEETPNANYIENHNDQCSGTIAVHQFRECDITKISASVFVES